MCALNIQTVFIYQVIFCDFSRRKVSVDENYEWDAADFCSQPGDHDGKEFSFLLICCSGFGTNTGKKK